MKLCSFLAVTLYLLFPEQVVSQELEIGNNNNYIPGGYYSTYTFNQRYSFSDHLKFYLSSTSYYKLKNVKKIEVYDASGKTLYYSLEPDTTGKIPRTGQLGYRYFTVVENHTQENGLHENYFTDYFPPYTTRTKFPDDLQNQNVIMITPFSYTTSQKRQSVPVRIINYIFKYGYFEKPA